MLYINLLIFHSILVYIYMFTKPYEIICRDIIVFISILFSDDIIYNTSINYEFCCYDPLVCCTINHIYRTVLFVLC